MAGSDDPDIRIGDQERATALQSLEVHLRAGRLDGGEFRERSAAIGRARTRRDLLVIFRDLPGPVPGVPETVSLSKPVVPPRDRRAERPRRPGALVALIPITLIALFLVATFEVGVHPWLLFLVFPASGILRAHRHGSRHPHAHPHCGGGRPGHYRGDGQVEDGVY